MKTLSLFASAALLGMLPQAQARDHVSVGIGFSAGPGWGRGCYSRPYYYDPYYYAAPYPVYTTPVYVAPPAPVYYYPPPGYPAAPVYQGSPVSAAQYPPVDNQTLRVQAALRQRKYYQGAIDGLSGPGTQAAIRAYQVDRGFPVTGRIDSNLLSDLGL